MNTPVLARTNGQPHGKSAGLALLIHPHANGTAGQGECPGLGPPASSAIEPNEELRDLLPGHTHTERQALERLLLSDGVCLHPLVVWQGTGVLLDGYVRFEFCTRHRLPFRTIALPFRNWEAARCWRLVHSGGQRQLPGKRRSYLRGMRYLCAREGAGPEPACAPAAGSPGWDSGTLTPGEPARSKAKRLAQALGVSVGRLHRDVLFAVAVTAIGANCGLEAREAFLAKHSSLGPADAPFVAALPVADQRAYLAHSHNGALYKLG